MVEVVGARNVYRNALINSRRYCKPASSLAVISKVLAILYVRVSCMFSVGS